MGNGIADPSSLQLAQIALAAALFLHLAGGAARAQSQSESDAYAWLQFGADGQPHVRVIPSDRAMCPHVTADERGVGLTRSVEASVGFDRILCDAALPASTRTVMVGGQPLPPLPTHITRFVVLGDTGCRIQGRDVQNCRDAQAWPFARIAAAISRERPRPDLIVHVGDYQYRETPCPSGDARCAGSPYGDNWDTWAVDFFEPGAPLFATAPIIWVRGNHESCTRSGLGWSRYLAPEPQETCREHDDPAVAAFADLRFVNVDSAGDGQHAADAAAFERDERSAERGAAQRETILLTHRPPLEYLAAHGGGDPNGSELEAIISGHVHLFAAPPFADAPPEIIVGTGGDTLSSALKETDAQVGGTIDERFGFAVFDRIAGGWSISERDPDGSEHRRCELRAHTVHC
jgi:hypothetical protein